MQYLGGKDRIGSWVASVVDAHRGGGRLLEPMCGGASITTRLVPTIASDVNPFLICLYRALQHGWVPPDVVSEETYHSLKDIMDPENPLTAFAGFGCSFAGKWFGGYARSGARNYALNAKRSLLKKMRPLAATTFLCADYATLPLRKGDTVYCDPPYANTTNYRTGFDHTTFWNWCRYYAHRGVKVLVSEYDAPEDFEIIASTNRALEMDNNKRARQTRVENIYVAR